MIFVIYIDAFFRCGTLQECHDGWFQKYSSYDRCINFDELYIYTTDFYCEFCCSTDNCNDLINPEDKYHPWYIKHKLLTWCFVRILSVHYFVYKTRNIKLLFSTNELWLAIFRYMRIFKNVVLVWLSWT